MSFHINRVCLGIIMQYKMQLIPGAIDWELHEPGTSFNDCLIRPGPAISLEFNDRYEVYSLNTYCDLHELISVISK